MLTRNNMLKQLVLLLKNALALSSQSESVIVQNVSEELPESVVFTATLNILRPEIPQTNPGFELASLKTNSMLSNPHTLIQDIEQASRSEGDFVITMEDFFTEKVIFSNPTDLQTVSPNAYEVITEILDIEMPQIKPITIESSDENLNDIEYLQALLLETSSEEIKRLEKFFEEDSNLSEELDDDESILHLILDSKNAKINSPTAIHASINLNSVPKSKVIQKRDLTEIYNDILERSDESSTILHSIEPRIAVSSDYSSLVTEKPTKTVSSKSARNEYSSVPNTLVDLIATIGEHINTSDIVDSTIAGKYFVTMDTIVLETLASIVSNTSINYKNATEYIEQSSDLSDVHTSTISNIVIISTSTDKIDGDLSEYVETIDYIGPSSIIENTEKGYLSTADFVKMISTTEIASTESEYPTVADLAIINTLADSLIETNPNTDVYISTSESTGLLTNFTTETISSINQIDHAVSKYLTTTILLLTQENDNKKTSTSHFAVNSTLIDAIDRTLTKYVTEVITKTNEVNNTVTKYGIKTDHVTIITTLVKEVDNTLTKYDAITDHIMVITTLTNAVDKTITKYASDVVTVTNEIDKIMTEYVSIVSTLAQNKPALEMLTLNETVSSSVVTNNNKVLSISRKISDQENQDSKPRHFEAFNEYKMQLQVTRNRQDDVNTSETDLNLRMCGWFDTNAYPVMTPTFSQAL